MNDLNQTNPEQNSITTQLSDNPGDICHFEDDYQKIIQTLLSYHPSANIALVRKAFEYACEKHKPQRRKSGEAYFIHPIGVAMLVTRLKLDEASICVAFLHDVVEDTDATYADIQAEFSEEIAALVDGLTKLSKVEFNTRDEFQAANYRKMLLAMNKDLRVIMIKLADRMHNMRTLGHMIPEKRDRIATETLDIFAPLAGRLGIEWVKAELEDLSLKYLHPEEYKDLEEKLRRFGEDRAQYISQVQEILRKSLEKEGIKNFQLKGRIKHIYSIYRKLKRSNGIFENLHDVIAFRVIVDSKTDCYRVLGIVHGMWSLVEGRFKDYISLPKPNNYRSLHTSVIGPDHERFEVQIRTFEMDRVAEEGIAAHWMYKEGGKTPINEQKSYVWLRQLLESQQEHDDPNEFMNTIKVDLFADEVYVFTPNGDIINLPRGSTPIDFAYAVHSELGNKCDMAIVNGEIVPLRYQLKTGDRVDIKTKNSQKPKNDWLQFVVSNRAKSRITRFLNLEEKALQKQIGTQILDKMLKKAKLRPTTVEKLPELSKLLSSLKLQNFDALLVALGAEKIKQETFMEKLQPYLPQLPEPEPEPIENPDEKLASNLARRASGNICVDGCDNLAVHFASCCSPVFGEAIMGFVTRGRGLIIHQINCPHIKRADPERTLICHWDPKISEDNSATRPVNLLITTTDRMGILVDITQAMAALKINITQTHCRTMPNGENSMSFCVQIRDVGQLNTLFRALRRIPGVITADRTTSG